MVGLRSGLHGRRVALDSILAVESLEFKRQLVLVRCQSRQDPKEKLGTSLCQCEAAGQMEGGGMRGHRNVPCDQAQCITSMYV